MWPATLWLYVTIIPLTAIKSSNLVTDQLAYNQISIILPWYYLPLWSSAPRNDSRVVLLTDSSYMDVARSQSLDTEEQVVDYAKEYASQVFAFLLIKSQQTDIWQVNNINVSSSYVSNSLNHWWHKNEGLRVQEGMWDKQWSDEKQTAWQRHAAVAS